MMNSTNFANSKQRVIRMGPRGGFYVSKGDGQKKRQPVAKFRKAADGSMVKLTKANLPNVPEAIRPARAAAAKATPKPRGRKPMSNSAKATKMFAKVLNKKVAPPKAKAAKVAAKNVIVVSPGGTLYKSKRSEMALKRAKNQKKLRRQNPFAALNKALMR